MEKFVTLLIPALVALVLVRLLLIPMKLVFKLGIHSGCGFLCLWLLNSVAGFTGVYFPINAVTVLTAGFLGLPGIGVMALLAILPL
ncbi:MAG: pro-sigmaK processing inhibitor BofA family protein [Faecousia sp.]